MSFIQGFTKTLTNSVKLSFMNKILMIEDDLELAEILTEYLSLRLSQKMTLLKL